MINMYHMDGDDLVLTHYCAGGNQPTMKLNTENSSATPGGAGASAVLETSGNPGARTQALQCIRPFGRCCYVGVGGPAQVDFNQDVIFKVATVFGSWTFSKAELLEIARFMVDARVPLKNLITHRYDLDQAVEAFQTFDGATTGKCVFMMD